MVISNTAFDRFSHTCIVWLSNVTDSEVTSEAQQPFAPLSQLSLRTTVALCDTIFFFKGLVRAAVQCNVSANWSDDRGTDLGP
jgi:hypothetical protein